MSELGPVVWLLLSSGWLVAAWLLLEDERNRSARQRIRAEESEAWADEYQRDTAASGAELDRLRERHATLTELYGEAVRRLLASNYVFVHRNLEWKRRRPDSEQKE